MKIKELSDNDYAGFIRLVEQEVKRDSLERPDIYSGELNPYTEEKFAAIISDKKVFAIGAFINDAESGVETDGTEIKAEINGANSTEPAVLAGVLVATKMSSKSQIMKPSQFAYVGELIVDEKFRRRSIASKLFNFLKSSSFISDCVRIELSVHASNEPAVKLYENLGMTARTVRYELSLEDTKPETAQREFRCSGKLLS